MFKKVAPYIGEYKKYTVWAAILMSLGIVAYVTPYFFLYQIISPLTKGEKLTISFILLSCIFSIAPIVPSVEQSSDKTICMLELFEDSNSSII